MAMGRLTAAVERGDKREILLALQAITAETIEETTSGRDVAALSKRLIEISEKIEALPNPDDINPVDDMADFIKEFDEYDDPRFEDEDD